MRVWRDQRGQALVLGAIVFGLAMVVLVLGAFRVAGGYTARSLLQDAADAAALGAAETAQPVVRLHVRRERVTWTLVCVEWASESGGCVRTAWRASRAALADAVVTGATGVILAPDGRLSPAGLALAGCDRWGGPPPGTDAVACLAWTREDRIWWWYPSPALARERAEAWLAANGFAPGPDTSVLDFHVRACDPSRPDDPAAPCDGRVWLTVRHRGEGAPLSGDVAVRAEGGPKRMTQPLPMRFP